MGDRVTVEPFSDVGYVDRLAHRPEILPFVTTDQVPDISVPALMQAPDTLFLLARFEGVPCGGFLFVGNEVHTMLLPPLRGRHAIEAGKKMVEWARKNRPWDSLKSYCYSTNPQTEWFAKRVGFVVTGTRDDNTTIGGCPVTTSLLELPLRPCL